AGASHAEDVGQEDAELEGARVPDGAMKVVIAAIEMELRFEAMRVEDSGRLLGGGAIRQADSANLAIAPGLLRNPLDGVDTIGPLVAQKDPSPLRLEAATHVLHDAYVAAGGEEFRRSDVAETALIVRGAFKQDRKSPGERPAALGGSVDIHRQPHPIAHRN